MMRTQISATDGSQGQAIVSLCDNNEAFYMKPILMDFKCFDKFSFPCYLPSARREMK